MLENYVSVLLQLVQEVAHGTTVRSDIEFPSNSVWRDLDDAQNVIFFSIHGHDGKFYPGVGSELSSQLTAPVVINVPLDPGTEPQRYMKLFQVKIIEPLIRFKPGK